MGWEKILKGRIGVGTSDTKLVNYILRDGEFKTVDRIIDEIYDLIAENKKMGHNAIVRMQGRPTSIRFGAHLAGLKLLMNNSPDYEVRDTGNKTPTKRPIKEYRYIGE